MDSYFIIQIYTDNMWMIDATSKRFNSLDDAITGVNEHKNTHDIKNKKYRIIEISAKVVYNEADNE